MNRLFFFLTELCTEPKKAYKDVLSGSIKTPFILFYIVAGCFALITNKFYSPQPLIWIVLLLLTPVFGWLTININSLFYRAGGYLLRGKAKFSEIRQAVVWSHSPQVIALIPIVLSAFIAIHTPVISILQGLLVVAVAIWSYIVLVVLLAKIHGFGYFRAVLSTLIIPLCIFLVFAIVMVAISLTGQPTPITS